MGELVAFKVNCIFASESEIIHRDQSKIMTKTRLGVHFMRYEDLLIIEVRVGTVVALHIYFCRPTQILASRYFLRRM